MKPSILALLLCLGLVACGGGGGGGTTTPPPTTGGSGSNPPATTPPSPPSAVTAGSTAVDITVPGPSQTPALNAQFLGAAGPLSPTGQQQAFTTGDFIHQNSVHRVILFGPGLSGVTSVRIGGSGDVTVVLGSVTAIKASDNTPGVAFDVNVPAGATLGPRTVYLVSGNDMTTFSGGLEVVP